ncbi:hypothetical protein [Mycoplasma sp. BRA285]
MKPLGLINNIPLGAVSTMSPPIGVGDFVLTVSDIVIDISWFKTSEEFNDNKNKY